MFIDRKNWSWTETTKRGKITVSEPDPVSYLSVKLSNGMSIRKEERGDVSASHSDQDSRVRKSLNPEPISHSSRITPVKEDKLEGSRITVSRLQPSNPAPLERQVPPRNRPIEPVGHPQTILEPGSLSDQIINGHLDLLEQYPVHCSRAAKNKLIDLVLKLDGTMQLAKERGWSSVYDLALRRKNYWIERGISDGFANELSDLEVDL